MGNLLRKIIEKIESYPLTFPAWLAAFLSLIVLRMWVENWLVGFPSHNPLFLFAEFTHTFFFFLLTCILAAWLFHIILGTEWKKAANVLLWGFFLIILPPLVDHWISGGQGFWSFYKFDSLSGLGLRFLTFFGDRPQIGITYGTRLGVLLSLIFFWTYARIKNNSRRRSALLVLAAYAVFFVLGTLPSWITILVRGFRDGFFQVGEIATAQMFLSPFKIFARNINDIKGALGVKMSLVYALLIPGLVIPLLWYEFRIKFQAFLRNARFPQLLYHAGLLVIGMGLALIFSGGQMNITFFNAVAFLLAVSAVFAAWLASVVVNDFVDIDIDRESSAWRPLPAKHFSEREYATVGTVLFLASLLFSAIINLKVSLFLLVYQILAWIYSAWPFRLKRFAVVSTLISAFASIMVMFSGYVLLSPESDLKDFPGSILWLLIIAYTVSLPLKDFKDIEGDRRDGVYTIPVLLGENWGKLLIGSAIFTSFVLSTVFLNAFELFWWSAFFGGAAFWIVNQMQKKSTATQALEISFSNITYHNIFWWVMADIALYAIVIIRQLNLI